MTNIVGYDKQGMTVSDIVIFFITIFKKYIYIFSLESCVILFQSTVGEREGKKTKNLGIIFFS